MVHAHSSPARRDVLVAAAAVGAASIVSAPLHAEPTRIRPFQVRFPDEALTDLRRRISAARWPTQELVSDASQGVQLATMRSLARYWASEHDWREIEAKLNALPMFLTEIHGLDIHFIHVRSKLSLIHI